MAQLGADVDELDALAGRIEQASARIGRIVGETSLLVVQSWWCGPDADRTRTWWSGTGRPQLRSLGDRLDQLAADVRRQAGQQRTASDMAGATIVAVWDDLQAWGGARLDDLGEWFDDRRQDWNEFPRDFGEGVDDVVDAEEDDDDGGASGFGIPGPFDDWARDGAEAVVDRGSTLVDYGLRTADRRIEHPIQSLVDVATGTVLLEDVTAGLQIGLGDVEIADHAYGNDAVILTNAWAPFEGGAITLGHTVSVNAPTVDAELAAHELQHVYDLEDVGGAGFYGSYGADWVWNYVVEGRRGPNEAYEDVVWERRAYGLGGEEPRGILGGIWKRLW